MRVFLVDDEFLQRALVKKTVDWNSLGMEICGEAEDGEEALKKILEEKPDILIMDINIPYMNGIEVSKKVKVIFPEIQVIILTAYGEFEYAREALSFGAVSFVLKPLDPEELTKELQKCKEKLEHIYRQKSSVKKMQKDQFLLEQLKRKFHFDKFIWIFTPVKPLRGSAQNLMRKSLPRLLRMRT